nr:4Fe-4S binding protein [uncultured Blautia sp.]
MKEIYPGDTRSALEVFQVYDAKGEGFDISEPSHIVRDSFAIGNTKKTESGYYVKEGCTGCGRCEEICPQKVIVRRYIYN